MHDPDQSAGRPPSEQSPELRASDAGRERAIELLQQHAGSGRLTPSELEERTEKAYAAKARADLAALLQDLPTSATGQLAGQGKARRWFVAILGRPQRRGRSRLRGHAIALSLLAAPDIDLCNADIEGSKLVIYAFSLFGGPDIYVADSMKVEMSGFSSLVGNELEGSQSPADPEGSGDMDPLLLSDRRLYGLAAPAEPASLAIPGSPPAASLRPRRQTSRADTPRSEPNPQGVGHSRDVTQPSTTRTRRWLNSFARSGRRAERSYARKLCLLRSRQVARGVGTMNAARAEAIDSPAATTNARE